VEYWN